MPDKAALFIKALRSLAPSSKQKVILELISNALNISIQCVVHLAYDVKPIFNHHMNNCVDRALGGRMNHKNSECKHEETAGCVWPLIVNQSLFVSICLFLSCLCAQTAQWQVMRFTNKYKTVSELSLKQASEFIFTHLSATFRAVCRKRAWSFSFRLCSACVIRALDRSKHWRQFAICWANLRSFITCNMHKFW